MQRGDGLVQRKNVLKETAASPEVDEADNTSDERDDGDSKDTRLTLMEEVLLLGLKDKEVRAFYPRLRGIVDIYICNR